MNLLDFIKPALSPVDFDAITTVKVKQCRDFSDLIEIYKRDMTITPSFVDCMAMCMTVHLATKLDGDPLWMYLVGAPSSGKSTICELLCADEFNTFPLSKFTGLVSGSTQGSHLASRFFNKCVVVKDGTLLLESTPAQLANVYGELRDAYDGSLEAHYRNGVTASLSNLSFGMLIGITEKIYGLNMSALGERFLHCRLETERETELDRNRSAISSIFESTSRTMASGSDEMDSRAFPYQRGFTAGFLSHLHSRIANEDIIQPTYSDDDIKLIQSLGDIIACSRAAVTKDAKDNILYDSRPESSTRAVKQLARLALGHCYVYGVRSITPKIREQITKSALDTSHSRQYYVLKALASASAGLTRESISALTGIPYESCRRIIVDLLSLKILSETPEKFRREPGAPKKLLTLPTWVKDSFRYGANLKENQDSFQVSKIGYADPKRQIRKVEKIRTRA